MEIPLLFISWKKRICLKNIALIVTGLISLLSCTTTNQTISQESLTPPADSSTQYFPLASSRQDTTDNALYTFINTWYSQMLFALHEPVLKDYAGNLEIYRFTWLRTFHHPVSIRLEKAVDRHRLLVKMSAGAGGYESGKLIVDKEIMITSSQWDIFQEKMKKLDFWSLSTREAANARGMDGSEWIMEGCAQKRYHVVTRWSPEKVDYPEFRDVADYLVQLSSLNIPAKEYY